MVTTVVSCCYFFFFYLITHSSNIRQIRRFLSPASNKLLAHQFVTSHLDCCNSFNFGVSVNQSDRLQKMLNAAARLIFRLPKFNHIASALFVLNWLPVVYGFQFKLLLLVYKALNIQAREYIKDLLQVKSTVTIPY